MGYIYNATCFDISVSLSVYSQRLAKLHTLFKMQLFKLGCCATDLCEFSDCSCLESQIYKIIKMLKYCLFAIKYNKIVSVLQSVVQSMCVCGCMFSAFVGVGVVLV